jgi:hypothetical protein
MFAIDGSLLRWLVRSGLALVVLAVVWGAHPIDSAYACSCMAPRPPAEARDEADAVFTGTVTGILQQPVQENSDQPFLVSFLVSQSWKGANGAELSVLTSGSSASCGYSFNQGGQYIVYATMQDGRLHTSLCSRTNALDQAAEDLAVLGQGSVPAPAPAVNPLQTALPWLGGFAVVALVIGGLAVALRKK